MEFGGHDGSRRRLAATRLGSGASQDAAGAAQGTEKVVHLSLDYRGLETVNWNLEERYRYSTTEYRLFIRHLVRVPARQ